MNVAFDFSGHKAVVTGCASGIGAEVVRILVASGAEVTGLDIKAANSIVGRFVQLDLSDPAAVEAAGASLGGASLVFNCAGISDGSGLGPERVSAINFLGLRHLVERLIPSMRLPGSIVSVASLGAVDVRDNIELILGLMPITDWDEAEQWIRANRPLDCEPYAFSKQCLIVYTMWRSAGLARSGIRINCTSPSPVQTPILDDTLRKPGNAQFLERFPFVLGRISTAQEQALALIFLNSDAASYITGQNIWIDGGYTAGVDSGTVRPFLGRRAREEAGR